MSALFKENAIWQEADSIYQRWKREEFDLDGDKAATLAYTHAMVRREEDGSEKRVKERNATIAELFSDAMSFWMMQKEGPRWPEAANDLVNTYTLARVRGCIVPGQAFNKELQVREHRIIELDLELKQTKDKLTDTDKRFKECGDRVIALETENQKLRERNPVFGIAQGTVDEVAEGANKEEGER